jgi:hypothetical protein
VKRRFGFIVLGLGLAWACGDDEKPPPPGVSSPDNAGEGGEAGSGISGSGTGGSNPGGSSGRGGGGQGGTSSGAAGTADPGGAGGDDPGGAGSGGTGGIPPCPDRNMGAPPTSGVCDPGRMLGPAMQVTLGDAPADLLAITPDELTIAWYEQTLMGISFYVADRATAGDAFDPGQQIVADAIHSALSPDGLRLVSLLGGGLSFAEFTRAARGMAFGMTPSEATFATINADAMSRGLTFTGAVISPNDRTLYYLVTDGESNRPLRISERTDSGPWPVGQEIAGCEFESHGDLFSQPTAVSADGLTLFFYDWARGEARAAWRRTAGGPFEWFEVLGALEHAQPNAGCDRLYYMSSTGLSFSTFQ